MVEKNSVELKDLENVMVFLDDCFKETYSFFPKQNFENFFIFFFSKEKLLNSIKKNHFIKISNEKNEIIGILDAYFDLNDCYCTVNSFYVKSTEQNKGIGKLIIKDFLKKVEKYKIDRIWMGFFIKNEKTFQIYKKFNFQETKREMIKIENLEFEYCHGYFKTTDLISKLL